MRKGLFMALKIKAGLSAVQGGLHMLTLGRQVLAIRNSLPAVRKRLAAKEGEKAIRQILRHCKKAAHKQWRQKAIRRMKGIGRVLLIFEKKYF